MMFGNLWKFLKNILSTLTVHKFRKLHLTQFLMSKNNQEIAGQNKSNFIFVQYIGYLFIPFSSIKAIHKFNLPLEVSRFCLNRYNLTQLIV